MPETDFKRSRNQQQQQQQQPQQQYQNKRRNQQSHTDRPRSEGPKREAILDLNKYKGEQIRVRCVGGRQITGILKGFDQLMNLVLEDVTEQLRDLEDEDTLSGKTRHFGLVVVRCTSLLTISPVDGSEIIDNPFVQSEN